VVVLGHWRGGVRGVHNAVVGDQRGAAAAGGALPGVTVEITAKV
jgi:hypothetical protein